MRRLCMEGSCACPGRSASLAACDPMGVELRAGPRGGGCRRAQDSKRDIQVRPFALRSATVLVPRYAPLRGHGFGTARLRHDPYDDGLTAFRMGLHMDSAGCGTFGPFATPSIRPRPTPTGDYPPRASHFPGGQ